MYISHATAVGGNVNWQLEATSVYLTGYSVPEMDKRFI